MLVIFKVNTTAVVIRREMKFPVGTGTDEMKGRKTAFDSSFEGEYLNPRRSKANDRTTDANSFIYASYYTPVLIVIMAGRCITAITAPRGTTFLRIAPLHAIFWARRVYDLPWC